MKVFFSLFYHPPVPPGFLTRPVSHINNSSKSLVNYKTYRTAYVTAADFII